MDTKPAEAPRTPDGEGRQNGRTDSGHGRAVAVVHYAFALPRWDGALLIRSCRSLALATVASFARGERGARKR